MQQSIPTTAEEWATRLGVPVREEEEYIRLQEECGLSIVTGVFLDTMSVSEVYALIDREKRENREIWGIVPPYTGEDDFPVRTMYIAGRPHIIDPEQQREYRQRLRLIAIIPQ